MKTLFSLFILYLLFSSINLQGQAPAIQWQKSLGGTGVEGSSIGSTSGVQQTPDGGYVMAGTSFSSNGDVTGNHGGSDYWIVKLDPNGNLVWEKSYGGTQNDDANSICLTSDGGYAIAGSTFSHDGDVTFNHSTGNSDYWIIKLNASGNLQWQKSFGGSMFDFAYSIQQTTDGGYIVAGTVSTAFDGGLTDGDISGGHGFDDYWIIKLDGVGNLEWQKALGGGGSEGAYSIHQTTDHGYVVAGFTSSPDGDVTGLHSCNHFEYCEPDYWVVKLDSSGNLQWEKTLGGNSDEEAYSIWQTTDGGYIVAGWSESNTGDVTGNHGGQDFWIVKLDAEGNLTWNKSLGGLNDEKARSIQQVSDGGYIIAGTESGNGGDVTGTHGSIDYWIVKLDTVGNLLWEESLGGTSSDIANSIVQTSDGGYIVEGFSSSNDGNVTGHHGSSDYWIVKLEGTPPTNTITTSSLASTACCVGASLSVAYTATGVFSLGNIFNAQLSNASGSFASPVIIGSLSSITSGTITATIPSTTSLGSHYRIRVVSATPGVIGSDNGSDVTLSTTLTTAQVAISAGSSTTFCNGGSVVLSVATPGLIYNWKYNGTTISGATNQNFTATATGSYNSDVSNSCGTVTSNSISVASAPPTTAQAAITAGGPTTFCQGGGVVLTVATSGLNYQWKKNNSILSGATHQNHTANKTGTYKCEVSNSCGSTNSNSISVTENSITVTISQSPCSGGAVLLTCTASPSNGVTFQWLKGRSILSGATNSTYSASSNAGYKCTVTSIATGCSRTSKVSHVTITCRTSDESFSEEIIVYPNPSSDYFNINTSSLDQPIVIYIYDLAGKLIESHQANGDEMKVGIALANGVYFLKVAVNNETMKVTKLVKNSEN